MLTTATNTFKFLFILPFKENPIFPSAIILIFLLSLIMNYKKHIQKLDEYTNNINNFIFDDWEEAKSLHGIPGILMSVGILGTFYLIYTSLSQFRINDIEEVSKIITHNIAPAFSISALGIFMSILYVIVEKIMLFFEYSKKMKQIKLQYNPTTYFNIANKQLLISDEILTSIKEQTKTFQSLNNFSESLKDASEAMKKFGKITVTLEETLNPKVLGEVISSALLKEMSPILNNIQSITKNVDSNSQKVTNFLENDLKNEIIIPLKNSVDNTSESMKSIENALNTTSEAMIETNKGFDKLNTSLNKLEFIQENFVQKLDNVLDKQREEFEKTTKTITKTYTLLSDTVSNQIIQFNTNSQNITDSFTGLSSEMQQFLIQYKEDYKEVILNQEKAIKATSDESIKILHESGTVVSQTIKDASNQLQSTLNGVDNALVKTSQSIKEELENFKNSYTDSLKGFLDSQEEILNKVFKNQTEKLAEVVRSFQETLESDVSNRKILNDDLEKLIKTTNGFVSSTQAMIATAFGEQQSQLINFMENNKSMQLKLTHIIENATQINENGNILTKELIRDTANLQKQFNDNQIEVLKKYQISVDEHLKDILNYMAAIIEASHLQDSK